MKGVLTMQLIGAGWTISTPNEEFTITTEQACAAKVCQPTGKVEIDERGFWILPSLDVDLRWAGPSTVEIRKPRKPWIAAELTYQAPPEAPPAKVLDQVTRWDRGVLPGTWTRATDSCKPGTKAWLYQPLINKVPARAVHGGSKVSEGSIKPCKDGKTQGIYPGK